MKNLVIIVCAFTLMLFASCNKPTTKNVTGNWCIQNYKIAEVTDSSNTTTETSFIDKNWQQISYSNGNSAQQNRKEGCIEEAPSLELVETGAFSKTVKYSYTEPNDSAIVYASEIITGTWELNSGKETERLILIVSEEMIRSNIIKGSVEVSDTVELNRYALAEKIFVYNIDNFSNKKIVLSLDEYSAKSKIESETISLERITKRNQQDINSRYNIEPAKNSK
mgnify:FL=1